MNLLDDRQLAQFRNEYLEREKEIPRYIGVYLSGVVIIFSWMIVPQSMPLYDMALGNSGYNIYAFMVVLIVNALFITFLIYKSLDVHDTTQFIAVRAATNSVSRFIPNNSEGAFFRAFASPLGVPTFNNSLARRSA